MKDLLKNYPEQAVEKFVAYVEKLRTEKTKDKDGNWALKNPWAAKISDEKFADIFKREAGHGLYIDGKHITIDSRGISYDYVAYKNKMLVAYPESEINFAVVFEGDEFNFETDTFKVKYTHKIANPFNKDTSKIVGAYCVIKNRRGEFLTTLDKAEIAKHRKVAKTDNIWRDWYIEMVYKTVIKKACKYHFNDVVQVLDEADEANYDLTNPLDVDLDHKAAIEEITTEDELRAYYHKHKGEAGVAALVTKRKAEINGNA